MASQWGLPIRRICLSCLGALLISLTACSGDKAQAQLAEAFHQANQAQTPDAMLALYYLEESDQQTLKRLQVAIDYELGLPIELIDFEALRGAPEETIHYTHDGIDYGPTLQPAARMRVRYATEDAFESLYTIGRLPDGQWRIISSKPR